MTLLWVMLGVGIGVAATVVYLTNRSIVPPILNMVGAMGSSPAAITPSRSQRPTRRTRSA